jgi:hypothetical protein
MRLGSRRSRHAESSGWAVSAESGQAFHRGGDPPGIDPVSTPMGSTLPLSMDLAIQGWWDFTLASFYGRSGFVSQNVPVHLRLAAGETEKPASPNTRRFLWGVTAATAGRDHQAGLAVCPATGWDKTGRTRSPTGHHGLAKSGGNAAKFPQYAALCRWSIMIR